MVNFVCHVAEMAESDEESVCCDWKLKAAQVRFPVNLVTDPSLVDFLLPSDFTSVAYSRPIN